MSRMIFFLGMILPLHLGLLSTAEAKIKIYFDLGETLIFKTDQKQWILPPQTISYLEELKDKDIEIAIVSNVPDKWGDIPQKVIRLKEVVAKKIPTQSPFPWHLVSNIYLPPKDELRKPNPYLFQQIKKSSSPNDFLVFIGEDSKELEVARQSGFTTFQVGPETNPIYPSIKSLILSSK